MQYFNHAGTSWPKPPEVVSALEQGLRAAPHQWPEIFNHALSVCGQVLGISDIDRLFFTSGATSALEAALRNLAWAPGERIITSRLEHHALARQLIKLGFEQNVTYAQSPYLPGRPFQLDFLEAELKKGGVKLVAVSHASNVTGELLPVNDIVQLAHQFGALVLVDAAQTAGVVPLSIDQMGADLVAIAGHKGPLGPQGIGLLYVSPTVDMFVPQAVCGPTSAEPKNLGSNQVSSSAEGGSGGPPNCGSLIGYCDLGSVNTAAAAALAAGLTKVHTMATQGEVQRRIHLTQYLLDGLIDMGRLTIYGTTDARQKTAAVGVNAPNVRAAELSHSLAQKNFIVSGGFQCAPWAHEALGTHSQGVVRISLGYNTSQAQVDELLNALRGMV